LIANYAIHGTVLGGKNQLISGDAPGIVADYVEQKQVQPVYLLMGLWETSHQSIVCMIHHKPVT